MSAALRKARTAWRRWRFIRNGMKPWKTGYIEYKNDEIARVLREGSFCGNQLSPGYGFRLDERVIEYPWLFSRLPMHEGQVLDAGSTLNFEFLLDQPALRQKKIHICTLAPEPRCLWRRGVSYIYEDLRRLPYRDDLFDWIVCLSTIEHVGMDNALYTGDGQNREESRPNDYLVALAELKRVLKPGGTVYITAPFGKAANHRWFQVFDYEMVQRLIRNFNGSNAKEDYFQYLPEGWRKCAPGDAATATIFDIHSARGYDADFAAAARAVFCLEMNK
jgi:SAM-dependent methyltransferase